MISPGNRQPGEPGDASQITLFCPTPLLYYGHFYFLSYVVSSYISGAFVSQQFCSLLLSHGHLWLNNYVPPCCIMGIFVSIIMWTWKADVWTDMKDELRTKVLYALVIFFKSFFKSTSLSLVDNLCCLSWVWHISQKSSATHSYQCVQYFRVSRQWYG